MSKTTARARELWAKAAGREADIARAQEEIAEFKRQAKWAEGQERRDRLTGHAEEAAQLAIAAADATSDMAVAQQRITDSIRDFKALGGQHNEALDAIRRKITAEGVQGSHTPPSPFDGSVGVNGAHVIIGEQHIIPFNIPELVLAAVNAADNLDAVPTVPPAVIHRPMIEGDAKFWINRESGHALATNNGHVPNGSEEVSRVEYLAHQWQLDLTALPAGLLDELPDADRARLAPVFLDQLDDSAKAEFARHLVPGSGNAA